MNFPSHGRHNLHNLFWGSLLACLMGCLALIATVIFPMPASAADIVDITPGEEYSGTYDDNETVYYRFTLEDDAIVSLKGFRTPNMIYSLALYTSLGSNNQPIALDLKGLTQLDFNGDLQTRDMKSFQLKISAFAAEEGEAFFPLSSGTYYLQVVPMSTGEKPPYKFVLDVIPFIYEADDEPNDDLETASVYKAGTWQEGHMLFNGQSADSSRQDWYSVNVPEAGTYRFDYASDGFFNGSFTWYNGQGHDIVLQTSDSSEGETAISKTVLTANDAPMDASISKHQDSAGEYQAMLEFPEAGAYFVCVQGTAAGTYKFSLSPVSAIASTPSSSDTSNESQPDTAIPAVTGPSTSSSQNVELIFMVGQTFYNSNGSVITMDTAPYTYNNRVFVPIRALANGIGIPESGIIWNSVDQTVTLTDGITTLSMVLDSPVLYINGTAQNMDVSPAYSSNRVFLPARYIAEAFGLTVDWDPVTSSVIIRGQRVNQSEATANTSNSSNTTPSTDQATVGTIELDRQMIGDELRKGSYNGSLLNGQPSGNGTWVDCLGRIKTGNFSMSSATDITIKNAHIAFPDGAEFTGTYTAVLYTAIEKFEGHFVFPNNGNTFDGIVENTSDLKQHMVGTYTLPSGKTVDVDRYYDLASESQ